MHRWQRFKCSRRGVIQLRRRQPPAPSESPPPAIKHIAVTKQRRRSDGHALVVIFPTTANFLVAGSYSSTSSVVSCPIHPPRIRTLPDGSRHRGWTNASKGHIAHSDGIDCSQDQRFQLNDRNPDCAACRPRSAQFHPAKALRCDRTADQASERWNSLCRRYVSSAIARTV